MPSLKTAFLQKKKPDSPILEKDTLEEYLTDSLLPSRDSGESLQTTLRDFAIVQSKFWESIKQFPILTAFLIWSKDCFDRPCLPEYASLLFEKDCLGFMRNPKICEYDFEQVQIAIGLIRCLLGQAVVESERLVALIVGFFEWLRRQSNQLTPEIIDPDLKLIEDKIVPHDKFIRLLSGLDERCRLIAKLLYFGNDMFIEEIIEIQIEHIQFKKHRIYFKSNPITYPVHVFEDIRRLIRNRSSGPVFAGRNDVPINPSTVFRNFKTVASALDLGNSFSPKTLASNRS